LADSAAISASLIRDEAAAKFSALAPRTVWATLRRDSRAPILPSNAKRSSIRLITVSKALVEVALVRRLVNPIEDCLNCLSEAKYPTGGDNPGRTSVFESRESISNPDRSASNRALLEENVRSDLNFCTIHVY